MRFVFLFACLSACVSSTERSPAGGSTAFVTRGDARRAWSLVDGDRTLGSVVRFEERDGARAWFSVRNEFGQELGLIDAQGRAFRHRAHEREPEWLGSATLAEGARRILGAQAAAELVEIDLTRLAAPHRDPE